MYVINNFIDTVDIDVGDFHQILGSTVSSHIDPQ
jgi:hypothetical protein